MSLTRQFEVHDDQGEYDHLEHLTCFVLAPVSEPPDADLARGEIGFWPTSTVNDFVNDVEASWPFEVVRQVPPAPVWVMRGQSELTGPI